MSEQDKAEIEALNNLLGGLPDGAYLMSKQWNNVDTIVVPFIPPFDSDVVSVDEAIGYGKKLPKEFTLKEIIGTQLRYLEHTDEWVDTGHKAIFMREKSDEL